MSQRIAIVNLEAGFPTLAVARKHLQSELTAARRMRRAVLKLIHGYGSSGTGGRLRTGLRKALALQQQEGTIGRVVTGESWSIFDPTTRELLEAYPALRADSDLERGNAGITIVEVQRR
jgi:hypothetical protein